MKEGLIQQHVHFIVYILYVIKQYITQVSASNKHAQLP